MEKHQVNSSPSPRVSVIIPAFNEEKLIEGCLQSLYEQEFQDFEIILVDDTSTDGMSAILDRTKDERTHVIRHETNGGPAQALLTASKASRGEYIAVIGADERSRPGRLARQVAFLDAHPEVALVGCQVYALVDEENRFVGRLSDCPLTDIELKWQALFINPVMTTTAMYRTSVIRAHGIDWDLEYPTSQDYKLFSEIIKVSQAANLRYRAGITRERIGISSTKRHDQLNRRGIIAYCNLQDAGLGAGIENREWDNLGVIYMMRYQKIDHLEASRNRLIELYLLVGRRYLAKHKRVPGLWRVRRLIALDVVRMLLPARGRRYFWKRMIGLFTIWPLYPLDFTLSIVRGVLVKGLVLFMKGRTI